MLYVHGWNDYFFQTHLADHLADLGFDFYALDLRRYGRSLRRGHLNGFITDLDDYALELDAAADVIAEDHDELLLMGHSTGGLITSLWAASNRDRISGLVLNSPWLDLQGSAIVRTLGTPVIDALVAGTDIDPAAAAGSGPLPRTVHISLEGWDYDMELKGRPARRSGRAGCERSCSATSASPPASTSGFRSWCWPRRPSSRASGTRDCETVDVVLDVDQIAAAR